MDRMVLTVAETAERLGMSRQAVYTAVANGDIPSIRIRTMIRIPLKAIEKLLETK